MRSSSSLRRSVVSPRAGREDAHGGTPSTLSSGLSGALRDLLGRAEKQPVLRRRTA